MRLIPFLVCLLIFSCSTQTSSNNQAAKIYSDTSTLYYKGKPLFIFGESIDKMTSRPGFFGGDSTHKQGDGYSYVAIDTFFIAQQSTGSINGTLMIEADKLRQIQRVQAWWAISVQMNSKTEEEAINTIRQKYFPDLPTNFIRTKNDTIEHKSFIEVFKFSDSTNIDNNSLKFWSFVYEAKHKSPM